MSDETVNELEVEIDPEWAKVRRFREQQYERAGIGEFTAFRLALIHDLDWHRVVQQANAGASDEILSKLYLD